MKIFSYNSEHKYMKILGIKVHTYKKENTLVYASLDVRQIYLVDKMFSISMLLQSFSRPYY